MIKLAKILLVVGAFFGIHPFAMAISIPLYSIGHILLWRNKSLEMKHKIKWTIGPLIGILISWLLIVSYIFVVEHYFYDGQGDMF